MIKKYIAIFLIVLMSISLYGCSKEKAPQENNTAPGENVTDEINDVDENTDEVNEDENENQVVDPNPKAEEVKVTLYFVNKKYIETGDESLEKLIPENRTILVENIPLEEAIVKELIKGTDSEKLTTVIPSNVVLLGVEVADGTAFVNFSKEGLSGGGMQEDFTIAQIVNTLLELDHIDKVQFLVDGKKAETLMGHISITDPFEKPLLYK
ncbi:MAG: GerMN domain-containing protein [Tissierellales bacterium]